MIDHSVPFFSNTDDDRHCFQASLKMVLKYFWPDRDFSWQELEKISAKVEGLWTWPLAAMLWLQANGFEVKNIEIFNYDRFIENPDIYLYELFENEVAEAQIKNSDLSQEVRYAKEFIKTVHTEQKIPTIENIKDLLSDGYIAVCNINARVLNQQEGYAGHFVVLKGFDDANLRLHDPGLPPLENREVSFDELERAWAYPDERAKNLMAFKLR